MKKIVDIKGMTCGHCVGRVSKVISAIDGVSAVDVSLDEKRALVEIDKEVTDEQFRKEIENAGYEVTAIELV